MNLVWGWGGVGHVRIEKQKCPKTFAFHGCSFPNFADHRTIDMGLKEV